MVAEPVATPVTTPPLTVAVPAAEVVHEPLPDASANVVTEPTHAEAVPVMADGLAFMVMLRVI